MNSLPPMPRIKRESGGGMPRIRRANLTGLTAMPPLKAKVVIERDVTWRVGAEATDGSEFTKGSIAETADTTGKCAMCHERKPAIELRWRPNYVVKGGHEVQGHWACRLCYAKAGKFDVVTGGKTFRAIHREPDSNRLPTPTEVEGMVINARIERGRTFMGWSGPYWWVEGMD